MNVEPTAGDDHSKPQLLYANFNQDTTCICVGTTHGYQLIGLNILRDGRVEGGKLQCLFDSAAEQPGALEETYLVERLFSSSLVALVTQEHKRKLKLCHYKKKTEICSYNYSDSIKALRLNRQRLLVVLEKSLYIHNIRDMKVLHNIRDTPVNRNGVCALSINSDKNFVAYPGSSQSGEVQIFDTISLKAVTVISAHDSPLAAVSFSPSGEKLATASEKGTLVRVFSVPDGAKLFEFQRGMSKNAAIYSLAFSQDEVFLASSSNTETVHLYRLLDQPAENPTDEQSGWMTYVGKALMSSASILPSNVSDVLSRSRGFAQAKLESSGLKNICAIATVSDTPLLLVLTADAKLTVFSFNIKDQKECKLMQCYSILDTSRDESGMSSLSSDQQGLIRQPLGSQMSSQHQQQQQHSTMDEDDQPANT